MYIYINLILNNNTKQSKPHKQQYGHMYCDPSSTWKWVHLQNRSSQALSPQLEETLLYETSSSSSSSPLLFVNPEISYELNKKKHCLQGTDGNGDHPTTTFEQLAEVACSLFWGLPGFPFLGTGWVVIWTKTFSSNVVNGKNTAEFEGTCVQSWCSHIKMFKPFWVTIVYNQSIIRRIWGWQQR